MKFRNPSLIVIAALVVITAAFSRIVLYPDNFSPIIAMAVFCGAMFKDKKLAFAMPLLAMLLSDFLFELAHKGNGFWGWGQVVHYGIFMLITVIAFNFKKLNVPNVALFTITGSVVFFLLSNSVFFFFDNTIYHTYPQTISGYFQCLEGGLPFFKTGIVADLTYSTIFFGGYYLLSEFVFKKATA